MAGGPGHYKQMPDEVPVSQTRIERKEHHTCRVNDTACNYL